MKTKDKIYNFEDIDKDLEDIRKHLYLESPEIWIDFSDKITDGIIDEMILFYATKFNHVNVLKFVVDNKILDLKSPSRNKLFPSILTHLVATSNEYHCIDAYNYLSNISNISDDKINTSSLIQKNDIRFVPTFFCLTCGENIFEKGYKILEEVKYVYDKKTQACKEQSRINNSNIFCSSCNNVIKDLSLNLIERICCVSNCSQCGEDLIKIGLEQKVKMTFNNATFIPSSKYYVCPCCQNEINKSQLEFFNL